MSGYIILLGAPGSGKGTHGMKLSDKYKIPLVSSSNLLLSQKNYKINKVISHGGYIDDAIIIEIFLKRLRDSDLQSGAILDGFPRTKSQAIALEDFSSLPIFVIYLQVNTLEAQKRILQRASCPKCGRSYKGDSSQCDHCKVKLVRRSDDNAHTIEKRIELYQSKIKDLTDFYKSMNKLTEIETNKRSVEEIFSSIEKNLGLPR